MSPQPLTVLFALVLCIFAGFAVAAPDWENLKRDIRAEFPEVQQLSTGELAALYSTTAPILLLDVREPDEFAISHLAGAKRVDSTRDAMQHIDASTGSPLVIVYCSVGYRSSKLAARLQQAGYPNIVNLEGSLFQWANEGRALVRGERSVSTVHPYDRDWGQLLRPELWQFSLD